MPILDGTLHSRPFVYNSFQEKLCQTENDLSAWINDHTIPLTIAELLWDKVTILSLQQGEIVDYADIFKSLRKPDYAQMIIQDPYLQNLHQLECLGLFLEAALSANSEPDSVKFLLRTKLPRPDQDRFALEPEAQQQHLLNLLNNWPELAVTLDLRPVYDKMHARFAYVAWQDGSEMLYLLERGFDLLKPGTRQARADTVIFQLKEIDTQVRTILKLPRAEPDT